MCLNFATRLLIPTKEGERVLGLVIINHRSFLYFISRHFVATPTICATSCRHATANRSRGSASIPGNYSNVSSSAAASLPGGATIRRACLCCTERGNGPGLCDAASNGAHCVCRSRSASDGDRGAELPVRGVRVRSSPSPRPSPPPFILTAQRPLIKKSEAKYYFTGWA